MAVSTVSIGEATKASWANAVKTDHEALSATVSLLGGDQLIATASATLTDSDGVGTVLVTATSTASINLPTAADNNNRTITIIRNSTGKVAIVPEGAETIQNAHASFASLELWLLGDVARLYCDGSGWIKLNLPTLHLLDESDRSADWDINVSPAPASWAEYDLGPSGDGLVPVGTTALFGFYLHTNADAYGIIEIRDGTSSETDNERLRFSQAGADTNTLFACPMIIKAIDGIFDIQEAGSSNEVANVIFNLWGYLL